MGKRFLAACAVSMMVVSGCSSSDEAADNASTTDASSATSAPLDAASPEGSAPSTPADAVVAKLSALSMDDVVMGAAFNKQLLSVSLQAVGFNAGEAGCVTDAIAASQGAAFDRASMSNLVGGSSLDPTVVMACAPPERLQQITANAGQPNLDVVPAAEFRQLMTGLVTAGYESAGLSGAESSCLSGLALAPIADEDSYAALQAGTLGAALDASMVTECLTTERIGELSR